VKTPSRIEPLVADGLVDHVLRQLMSGKEAMVYVVQCGDEVRCAKVYKEANKRGFHKAADYTEGRKVKNSRQARAMAKGSRYGRQEQEAAWQHAEVDALRRLAAAGVRVPTPYDFHEGVLLMELVADEDGEPAPRLNDVVLERGRCAALPCRSGAPGRAHAVCRHRPWGPVGIQRAGRSRRAGDHRSAAGGRCRRQQQRPRHARARRR
jgi:serine/threonine-protein kinase RIO1